MRLKQGFVMHDIGGEYMAVATGAPGEIFNGLIRNNETADFIFRQLLQDTTEEKIVNEMLKVYDAEKNQIKGDVHRVVEVIRKAGFLDE